MPCQQKTSSLDLGFFIAYNIAVYLVVYAIANFNKLNDILSKFFGINTHRQLSQFPINIPNYYNKILYEKIQCSTSTLVHCTVQDYNRTA